MSFFKKYNGSTNTKLVRLERLVWVLIYGGLLSLAVSHFLSESDPVQASMMAIGGLVAVLTGAVLIFVRSRLREESDDAT